MATTFREPTWADRRGAIMRVVLLTLWMIAGAILLTYLWELPGFLLWIVLTIFGTAWLIRWHTRSFGYLCPNCGHTFTISTWTNVTSMNLGDRKSLRCPNCSRHSECKIMVIERGYRITQ